MWRTKTTGPCTERGIATKHGFCRSIIVEQHLHPGIIRDETIVHPTNLHLNVHFKSPFREITHEEEDQVPPGVGLLSYKTTLTSFPTRLAVLRMLKAEARPEIPAPTMATEKPSVSDISTAFEFEHQVSSPGQPSISAFCIGVAAACSIAPITVARPERRRQATVRRAFGSKRELAT